MKHLLLDSFGWGFTLWFVGYLLGILFFFILPASLIGWAILPLGFLVSSYVAIKRIQGVSILYYLLIASTWAILAMFLDYLFIVLLLHPADGYYKADVYLYYILTFLIPISVGWYKTAQLAS